MKNLIESLDEHIAVVPAPLGRVKEPEVAEEPDDDEQWGAIEEGLGKSHIDKIVGAMMASPQLQPRLEAAMKRAGGVKDDMDLDAAVQAARQSLEAHLRSSVPLALADVGAVVTKAISTRARRSAKAIGKGKTAMEATRLPDDDLGDLAEALIEDETGAD